MLAAVLTPDGLRVETRDLDVLPRARRLPCQRPAPRGSRGGGPGGAGTTGAPADGPGGPAPLAPGGPRARDAVHRRWRRFGLPASARQPDTRDRARRAQAERRRTRAARRRWT